MAHADAAAIASPRLVGRDAELRALLANVAQPPSVSSLAGEAGVGKSRLIRELVAQPAVSGHVRLLAHASPLRSDFLLAPVVDALRTARRVPLQQPLSPVAAALRPLMPELDHLLPAPPEDISDTGARRHRLYRGAVDLLGAMGPALLVLEDLHWADEATFEFLSVLVAEPPPQLSVVVTYRPEDLANLQPLRALQGGCHPSVQSFSTRLGPLDIDGVGQLIARILGVERVSAGFAEHVRIRTGGLPFAVEEVLRLLQEREDIVRLDGEWLRRAVNKCEVPSAVRDAVLLRVDGVSDDAQQVLHAVAAWGREMTEAQAAKVSGLEADSTVDAIAEALSAALLVEMGGGVGFRHALARDAVYGDIVGPERRALHRRCAEVLQSQAAPDAAEVAQHWRSAGSQTLWVRWSEVAASDAVARGDEAAACHLLADVLGTEGLDQHTRVRVAVALGRSALQRPPSLYADTAAILRRVLDEPGLSPSSRGELRLSLGWLLMNCGELERCYEEIRDSIPDLDHNPGLQARAMSTLALPVFRHGTLADHEAWAQQAVELALSQEDPVVRAAVLVDNAIVAVHTGAPGADDAVAALGQLGTSVEDIRHDIRACVGLATSYLLLGRYDRTLHFVERGQRLSREARYERHLPALRHVALSLALHEGRLGQLDDDARGLVADMGGAGHFDASNLLGQIDFALGRLQPAKDHLERALEFGLAEGGQFRDVADVAAALSAVAAALGDHTKALEVAQTAIEPIRRKQVWVWASTLVGPAVDAFLASGERSEAEALVDDMRKGLCGRDAPAAQAALLMVEGVLAAAADQHHAAAGLFEAARSAWEVIGNPRQAGLACEQLARSLLATSSPGGEQLLQEAESTFARLGFVHDRNRARSHLRTAGVAVPHRRGRKGYGSQLSPRELEVARLAASGLTNREIGQALFLSPRTAGDHVLRSLRKLGLASRTELSSVELEKST